MDEERKPIEIFARPTSGLIRSIGVFGAFVFGVHCISLSSSGFIPFSWVASVWPGASIIGLLLIAMTFSILHGYTFACIGISMPRSGADYVLASRILNPKLAFMGSWTLVIFSGIVAGGLIAWIPKSAIPALFKPMAIIFNYEPFSKWAEFSSTSKGSIIIGLIFVAITFCLMLPQNKTILKIMYVGLILGVLAWAIIFFSFIARSSSFVDAWNKFMSASSPYGEFSKRIELARAAGMSASNSTAIMTLAGLIMGFWIFYGYYIPTFFAGEVKTSQRTNTLLKASLASIIFTGAIFIIAAFILQHVVGVSLEWIAAEGYIFNNPQAVAKVAGQQVTGYPWITFYAAILKPIFPLVLITSFAWIFTLVNLAQSYFFYSSRIMLAWSFDRIIPRAFSFILPKTKSPIICIISIAMLAIIGVVDASLGGPLGTQLTFAFFAVITQLVSVWAIIKFPKKAPDLYRLTPPYIQKKILGIPKITFLGSLTFIYLLWLIIASFLFPAVGVASPKRTILLLFILAFSGLIVFLIAQKYHKKRSDFDISLIYKNPPPA
jgi:amino acid transporter